MKIKFLSKELLYDGSQLRTHFGYEYGVDGDSIIGFVGGADVKDHMVDQEDVKMQDFIFSEKMLHFIITIFNQNDTEKIVLVQRMFMSKVRDILNNLSKNPKAVHSEDIIGNIKKINGYILEGDDILKNITGEKLTVSIATKSLFAGMIHVGLNISQVPEGKVKVKTCCLEEISKNFKETEKVKEMFKDICESFVEEYMSVKRASYKVIPVK